MLLPITSIFTALFALMMVPLSLSISIHYARTGKNQADEGVLKDETLRRKTRAHGNFIEYVPLALILLAMLEVSGETAMVLWSMGTIFLCARLIHAAGQRLSAKPALRGIGMMTGHMVYLVGAVRLIMLNI